MFKTKRVRGMCSYTSFSGNFFLLLDLHRSILCVKLRTSQLLAEMRQIQCNVYIYYIFTRCLFGKILILSSQSGNYLMLKCFEIIRKIWFPLRLTHTHIYRLHFRRVFRIGLALCYEIEKKRFRIFLISFWMLWNHTSLLYFSKYLFFSGLKR